MSLRLRELRMARKLSQQEIADIIGCSAVTYSRYETGRREPSIDLLIALSNLFGVSVDYIVGKSGTNEYSLSEFERSLINASRTADANVREIVLEVLQTRAHRKEVKKW